MKNKKQRKHPYLINWIILGLIILLVVALSFEVFQYIMNQNLNVAHTTEAETKITQNTSSFKSPLNLKIGNFTEDQTWLFLGLWLLYQ